MNVFMANKTKGNNVKPMFLFVTKVMIYFSLCVTTRTGHLSYTRYCTVFDSFSDSIVSIMLVWIGFTNFQIIFSALRFPFFGFLESLNASPICHSTFWATTVFSTFFLVNQFPFFGLSICLFALSATFVVIPIFIFKALTMLTSGAKTVFAFFGFAKFIKGFDCLAFRTSFRHDVFSHFFSLKKVMVRAVCGLRPTDGSFYYNKPNKRVNYFMSY